VKIGICRRRNQECLVARLESNMFVCGGYSKEALKQMLCSNDHFANQSACLIYSTACMLKGTFIVTYLAYCLMIFCFFSISVIFIEKEQMDTTFTNNGTTVDITQRPKESASSMTDYSYIGESDINSVVRVSSDLKKFGANESSKVSGNPIGLEFWLHKIYYQFLSESDAVDNHKLRLVDIEREKIAGVQGQIDVLRDRNRQIEEVDIPYLQSAISKEEQSFRSKIDQINGLKAQNQAEIIRIRGGDESLVPVRLMSGEKVGLYLGWAIFAFLTFYLYLFYASVIFSAFLLPDDSTELPNQVNYLKSAVLNPMALPTAFSLFGGWAFSLVVAPFVFFGFGFLLYRFNWDRQTDRVKIVVLYAVTFLFDALLAFEIVRKMHIAGLRDGTETALWQANIAFGKMEYWIILAAGFLVYIIWGIMLNYVLTETSRFAPERAAINLRKSENTQLELQKKGIQDESQGIIVILKGKIDVLVQQVTKNVQNISELQALIGSINQVIETASRKVYVPTALIIERISTFSAGWISYIDLVHQDPVKSGLINRCKTDVDAFTKFMKNGN
jgi:hypothetical protein